VISRASVQVASVHSDADLRRFIEFPHEHYAKDPHWVATLRLDQLEMLNQAKHPFYQHAEMGCFLARLDGRVCGRIAAIFDRDYNAGREQKVGTFGFYESVDSQYVADALFEAAKEWVAARGASMLRGPMNPSINYECGLLMDGFDLSPMVMTTFNPPYYASLFENAGLRKARDLYAYRITRGAARSALARLDRAAMMHPTPDVQIRPLELNHFDSEVESVWSIYNSAWSQNWGAAPMTLDEFRYLGRQLKPLLIPKLGLIAEHSGQLAGFGLVIPDINQALKHAKGSLFPLGLFKILYYKSKIRTLRVLALGVLEPYRGPGITARLSSALLRSALELGYQEAECSWIVEDNSAAIRSLEFLGAIRYKTYRIYEATLPSRELIADARETGACAAAMQTGCAEARSLS
jgi:GNAT superfamily N-acetyltransferase